MSTRQSTSARPRPRLPAVLALVPSLLGVRATVAFQAPSPSLARVLFFAPDADVRRATCVDLKLVVLERTAFHQVILER